MFLIPLRDLKHMVAQMVNLYYHPQCIFKYCLELLNLYFPSEL